MAKKIVRMDASQLCLFLRSGSDYLGINKEEVNALNVFPVPDGDTGINMFLTVNSAVAKLPANPEGMDIGKVASDFATGALMGARGNSGVILSQMFRGFATALSGKKDVDSKEFAAALQKGVDLSYKSVMKPVEGTILTVYRELVAEAEIVAQKNSNIIDVMQAALVAGEKSLENTPNLLPVLKEAGVIDSGGKGLLFFLEGATNALMDEEFAKKMQSAPAPAPAVEIKLNLPDNQNLEFTYCTQTLIKGENLPLDTIRERLSREPAGDSLLVVGDETVIKIHFHTNHPGQVLEYCSGFGTLHDIIIDNMADQHHQTMINEAELQATPTAEIKPLPEQPKAHCGVIAVCAGEGMKELYENLNAIVISGGQTMNPSAEDLLHAVEQAPAEQLVLLPNNSNIILTAEQVAKLSKKPVSVVNSAYVTEGLVSLLAFNAESDAKDNKEAMEKMAENPVNGEITYAIRDSKYNGFKIKSGDILGLCQGKIVMTGKDLSQALLELLEIMIKEHDEAEIISLYYGNDMPEEEAESYRVQVEEKFSDLDVEIYPGGQPLYYFLLSVE